MAENGSYRETAPELREPDISELVMQGWRHFLRTWWLLALLMAAGAALLTGWQRYTHTDEYEAYASFSVRVAGSNSDMDNFNTQISLTRLGESFPYVLESGALRTVIREELGLSSLPVTISASVVSDTSLFRISVRGTDAQLTARVLDTVIAKYPEVARYVIGNTTLTMLDYSGIPSRPVNAFDPVSAAVRGAAVGFLVYLGILSLLLMARRTVESAEDLKRYTSIRCLATVPRTLLKKRSRRQMRLLMNQKSVPPVFSEALHLLRIRTVRELDRIKGKVLLVTSAGEMEGKTTITANLALSCAHAGFRVLLIDGDLRHPSVAPLFGLTGEAGLGDLLDKGGDPEGAILHYTGTTLDILPGTRPIRPEQVPNLFGRAEMRSLMAHFRKSYDYVIVDSPPSGLLQDALTLTQHCDAALAVIRQNYLTRTRILDFLDVLTDSGIRVIGCVINGEEAEVGSYGYGRYGYGRAYGKYGTQSKYSYGYGEKDADIKRPPQ